MKKKAIIRWIGMLILITVLGTGMSYQVMAGEYPRKPVRMIYPFPAGSGGDIATRIFADALSKELGVPVKVSNITGGRATIGAAEVAKSKPDGYTLGSLPIGPAVTQPIFSKKLAYGTDDLEPLCQFTYLPIVVVSGAHTPYKTMKEFISYAKKNPGKVKFAHPGVGTVPFLMMKAVESSTGISMKGIPFKGLKPGITAVAGGHVDVALGVLGGVLGLQKAGKVNVLGLFAANRMELAPGVPTVEEDGVKVYPQLWTGIFAPKGLDPVIKKKLEDALAKAAKDESFTAAMLKAKSPVLYQSSKEFKNKITADITYFNDYKAKSQ
jgi:tripartite-type tricarboxylate transporter receptor subunit TctC